MSETPYGLETRLRDVEMRGQAAARQARRGHPTPARSPVRHQFAERLRRVADRLDG